ncbi:MAG: extracellular solute-binding protein [Lachnospiraceae bacterium]|nr:extracellular solute-binding protein [Lachnospiraceae bacterium]
MKKTKKITALMLTAAIAAGSLAGCGGGGNSTTPTTTASNSPTTTASSNTPTTTAAKDDNKPAEMPKITFQAIDHQGGFFSTGNAEGHEEVLQRVKDYTGIDVEYIPVANDSLEEIVGVTLLDTKNLPMIMSWGGNLNATIISAAKAGAFWNLEDYIFDAEKYPNLSKANKDVLKQITVDGHIIGLYRARPIGRNGLGYRYDWADKLGLSAPETVDDVYNMAKAFTEQDPDGDGQKNTYGFCLCKYTGPIDIIQTWFGAGNGWVEKDGQLIPSHMTDEYWEGVNYVKKMYDEGLVYSDWAIRDTNTWADGVKNGECGLYLDVLDGSRRIWDYFVNTPIPSVNGDETASMALVGAIAKEKGGKPVTMATSGMNGFFMITKGAKTEADLEACLTYLDKMCDDEMLTLADHGLEGIGYEMQDGYLVDINTTWTPAQKPHTGLNQTVCYIPNEAALDPVVKKSPQALVEAEVKTKNVENAVFNPAVGYLAGSDTYALNGATLDAALKDARTQYICGEIDEAGFRAAMDTWLAQGGQKIIDEINALYQADK